MIIKQEENLLSNLKVLYVEDEEFHREQLGIFLKRRVGKLYLAENGEDGLNKFKEFNPDIVITDLKMPEMDGIEMARNIRDIDKNCAIIITSAFSDVETILQVVNVGIDNYVIKPIKNDELMEALIKAAVKIFKQRQDETIINDNTVLSKTLKTEVESKIKNLLARFIKTNTGKGPKDIDVFISGDIIEIKALDTLTLFEKKLLENSKNYSMINYNRQAFYMDRKEEIEEIIREALMSDLILKEVIIDSSKNVDMMIISIK
ncbi:Na-translocating system protein MpsC family protein [Clostridium sp.]|uniref:Na-translocating system protein MpsC family protein n=1 Tax=Clostridium sp. TaxID=1506 RepID=UPI003F4B259B